MGRREKSQRNLKPIKKGELSSEEAKARGSKGGRASADAYKEKKKLRELCELYSELPVTSDKVRAIMAQMGISPEDMTNKMEAVVGLFNKAAAGDVQAFNAIRDIAGEKPIDEVESHVATNVTVNYVKSGIRFASTEDEIDDER